MSVFYRGVGTASNWLDYIVRLNSEEILPYIHRYHINERFVGYIQYPKPVTRRKASYDLKIDQKYLCGDIPSTMKL